VSHQRQALLGFAIAISTVLGLAALVAGIEMWLN
jgi:hypothetical protein